MKKGELRYFGEPIQMAGIAKNKVWSLNIPAKDFDEMKEKYVIIHHILDGDTIRLRCLSDEAPSAEAKIVKANLEDAYLHLLTSDN